MNRIVQPVVTTLCVIAAALVVLMILVPAALGLQRYVITGGSMTGTIAKGSVIYSRLTPVGQLKVGDIITFVPPGTSAPSPIASSASIRPRAGNESSRPRATSTRRPTSGASPSLSHAKRGTSSTSPIWATCSAALSMRLVRLLLIGLPALAVAVSLLWSLWHSADDEMESREASRLAAATPSAPHEIQS